MSRPPLLVRGREEGRPRAAPRLQASAALEARLEARALPGRLEGRLEAGAEARLAGLLDARLGGEARAGLDAPLLRPAYLRQPEGPGAPRDESPQALARSARDRGGRERAPPPPAGILRGPAMGEGGEAARPDAAAGLGGGPGEAEARPPPVPAPREGDAAAGARDEAAPADPTQAEAMRGRAEDAPGAGEEGAREDETREDAPGGAGVETEPEGEAEAPAGEEVVGAGEETPEEEAPQEDRARGGRRRGRRGRGGGGEESGEQGVEIRRDAVSLPRPRVELDADVPGFDAPRRLDVEAKTRPRDETEEEGARTEPPGDDHRRAYEEAAAELARLHAALRADAASEQARFRALAATLADRRQAALDRALAETDAGLDAALQEVAAGEAAALALAARIARDGRRRIAGAAQTVRDTLKDRAEEVDRATADQRDDGAAMETWAADRGDEISAEGDAGQGALSGLARAPGPPWPGNLRGAAMRGAVDEVLQTRVPPVASERAEKMGVDRDAHAARLMNAGMQLQQDVIAALQPFDDLLTGFRVTGPADVQRQETAAYDGLGKAERRLKRSLRETAAATRAALAEQHAAQREGLAESARTAARIEAQALQASGQAALESRRGLAEAQPATLRMLRESFLANRSQPPDVFARIVRDSAQAAAEGAARKVHEQRGALDRGATGALDRARAQTAAAAAGLAEAASRAADAMRATGQETASGLHEAAEASRPGVRRMADPVAAVLDDYPQTPSRVFEEMLRALEADMRAAWLTLHAAWSEEPSQSGGGEGGASEGAQTRPAGPAQPAATVEAPTVFVDRACATGEDAKTGDAPVGERISGDRDTVAANVAQRYNDLRTAFAPVFPDGETILRPLRGLTRRRGAAVEEQYSGDLRARIRREMWNGLHTGRTIRANIRAAMAWLDGRPLDAARHELDAAVVLWNDSDRVDEVMKSLTPAQMAAFNESAEASGLLSEVAEDLNDEDRAVFDLLIEGDVNAAEGLRMQDRMADQSSRRGDRRADAAVDLMRQVQGSAGASALAGAGEFDTAQEREARRDAAWQEILTAAGNAAPTQRDADGNALTGREALIAYATRDVVYYEDTGGPHGGGHYERRVDRVRDEQRLLIRNLAEYPADAPEVRAATLLVEDTRAGGAKDERVRQALDDPELNAGLANPLDPEAVAAAGRKAEEARARRDYTFRLLNLYRNGPDAPDRDPQEIRAELGESLARGTDDPARGEYLRAMATGELHDPAVAVAAFNYAMDGAGTRDEVLKAQFRSMSREQVDAATEAYNAAHPGGPPLYERIGLFDEGNFWDSETSGDAANELEVLTLGVPRNDRERMEVAALTARQQQESADSSLFGPGVAGEQYERLGEAYTGLLDAAGVEEGDFDSHGRLRVRGPDGETLTLGNFDETGGFRPPPGTDATALAQQMIAARGAAEGYNQAVDSVANVISTAIVVTAAVVTSALTGGAAASIWLPVLVTMGAGVAAMGVNAAIKGNRYGHEEMAQDFAMTVVQAATAGVGAAVGAGMRGGGTAVKALSGRLSVGEKALERFVTSQGGRFAGSLGLADEMLIGGISGAMGSGGNALLDDRAWEEGRWGEEFGHSMLRGFLSGGLAAGAMRPFSRAAGSRLSGTGGPGAGPERFGLGAQAMIKGLGSGVSGSGSAAFDMAYDHSRGRDVGSFHDAVTSVIRAGAQNAVQSWGEAHGEAFGDASGLSRSMQGRRIVPRRVPSPSGPEGARARPPEEAAGPAPRPAEGPQEAPARRPAPGAPEAADRPPAEAARAPNASEARDLAETLDAVSVGLELGLTPEQVAPTRIPGPDPDAAAPPRPQAEAPVPRPGPETEAPAAPRLPGGEGPARGRATPPPLPEAMGGPPRPLPDVDPMPEATVMQSSDPTSRDDHMLMYRNSIGDDPAREAAIYRNAETGEYIVVQGEERVVSVGTQGEGLAGPAAEGHSQRWKELLDSDAGRWELEAHHQPGVDPTDGRLGAHRLPSGAGGDFSVLMGESRAAGGGRRVSEIHVGGEMEPSTRFSYDPDAAEARFRVEFHDPRTGASRSQDFDSLDAYARWFMAETGQAMPTAFDEGPAQTLLHGTHTGHGETIRREGIDLQAGGAREQDFGAGFYMARTEADGQAYADRTSANGRARAAAEGRDAADPLHSVEGEVMRGTLPLSELGSVVDVRPGGAHRELWVEFLGQPLLPRGAAMTRAQVDAVIADPGGYPSHYVHLTTKGDRASAFEAFLRHHGLDPDVVVGDLGGLGTAGTGTGEQVMIRSPRAARRMERAMGVGVHADVRDAPLHPDAPRTPEGQGGGGRPPGAADADLPPAIREALAETEALPPGIRAALAETEAQQAAAARRAAAAAEEALPPLIEQALADTAAREAERAALSPVDRALADIDWSSDDRPAGPPPPEAARQGPETRAAGDAAVARVREMIETRMGAPAARRLDELLLVGGPHMRRMLLAETLDGRLLARGRLAQALAEPLGARLSQDEMDALREVLVDRGRDDAPEAPDAEIRREAEERLARWAEHGMGADEAAAMLAADARLYDNPAAQLDGATRRYGYGRHRRDEMAAAEAPVLATARDRVADPALEVEGKAELLRALDHPDAEQLRRFAYATLPRDGGGEWDLLAQWGAYRDMVGAHNRGLEAGAAPRAVTAEGFMAYVRGHQRRTQLPRVSEVESAFQTFGVEISGPTHPVDAEFAVLKWAQEPDPDRGPHATRNEPNAPGSDLLGVNRETGQILYVDDKAWQVRSDGRDEIDAVGALTRNLAGNMEDDAAALDLQLRAMAEAGVEVDPVIADVPRRLREAAAAVRDQFSPETFDLERHGPRLARLMAHFDIRLAVTNARPGGRRREDVTDKLKKAGVEFLTGSVQP
ncbi:hypothetical protein P2H44_22885 [Albimonas sp. CAU 1670]|uniref:hypothetical protein n=1 Tax=Albimonas sp. CAU 1670 TaxID=3032599 RepID=UPI0023DB4582|nr:hypothetical protein [Albimonas sp. CAU 1670]MDF2235411.1 hypothetical protein [Albimonas sp. CAU 1670]